MTGRAERRRRTKVVQRRRMKQVRNLMGYRDLTPALVGHLRKHDPHDCGKPQCMTCHSEKVLGKPRVKHLEPDEPSPTVTFDVPAIQIRAGTAIDLGPVWV